LDDVVAALDRAAVETTEMLSILERTSGELDHEPYEAERIEERLFSLRALARKHATDVDSLADVRAGLAEQLAGLENGELRVRALEGEMREAREAFAAAAKTLGVKRRAAAKDLDSVVAGELDPLRLDKAVFSTRVVERDESAWGEHGSDDVAFEVATNPGAPSGPLNRISSGGELARFMLALKVVLARADPVPTMIFDEVDASVGGAVAAAVGERLDRLARDFQVLVVTHSPQVAARGAHHWRVSKTNDGPDVRTAVELLSEAARKEEIARMLAGARVTDEARAAADRLLTEQPG
jgi:DNA repair protein RecN (Recombination protein N)